MSKSGLKAEDIFFGLQKNNENKNKAIEEAKKQASAEEAPKPKAKTAEEKKPEEEATETPKAKAPKKTATPEKKKRGPVANPENSKRVPVNVLMPPEVKYGAMAVVNELKMRGLKERYSLTDFVIEAVEEKVKRTKKQLDME